MNSFEYFLNLDSTRKILAKNKIKIAGSNDDYNMMLMISDFYFSDKSIFVILPNLYQAQKYYDAIINYIDEDDVLFFPADELVSAEMIAATGDFLFERIQTLYTLISGNKKIIVTNMHGAIKYEMSPNIWKNSVFSIKLNDSFVINELCHKFIRLGYEPTYQTTKTGQFSKRGSIVDIFPLGYNNPVRIDFFGDDVDTLKFFDKDTQRSFEAVSKIDILPVSEFIYDDNEYQKAKNNIKLFMESFELSEIEKDIYNKDLYALQEHKSLDALSRYLEFFSDELSTILDFAQNKKIYIIDPVKCMEGYQNLILDLNEYCGRIGGYSISHLKIFRDFNNTLFEGNVLIEGLRTIMDPDMNVYAKEITPYNGNQKAVLDSFRKLKNEKKLIIAVANNERIKKLQSLFEDEEIYLNEINNIGDAKIGLINLIKENLPAFDLPYEGFILINEASIFNSSYIPRQIKYKSIYKNATKISRYDELCIGDYVVHYNHGIGRYMGIKTAKFDEIERDYLYIEYANSSSLMIPLEQISSIMKYASKDTEGVKIHEIGGTQWARTKAKVRKRINDISDKLIALYAARAQQKGFAFPKDSEWQLEFEDAFDYELTPDQKKAIDAIKRDMESSRPMDRLVCGDVGYGKTEVALRAAFKAVMGGKQVCMLAPTTILARQHYLTFKRRMDDYGVRVELLSRFVGARDQKKIIEDLETGGVDVVIGTHRVLSDEIKYKDLGLLIVDEEQRFGVTHKEKIKELKVNVDCITLSATPIPRTLQMSVMGIKDLSMIETPPKNRYPIQTYVLERNDKIIRDAIERELVRGGQIFYLYNRVDFIEDVAAKLHQLVPEAKIAIGHGKMSKDALENVISKFIDHQYDILLCTTIIETGIDMPDTNTLIIHDADRLGLSQMYQIRGRVGRSSKIAYAYLMYEPRKKLTAEAEKRLETIKEFNELGSGFKIAMRDLSIRGAGDLLGEEQSGFVESVGLDVYLKILDEEINKKPLKEEEAKQDLSLVTPLSSRTIRQSYIDNDDARIEIHKKIDKLTSLSELEALHEELIDRFGKVSDELEAYMYETVMKVYTKELGIYKIKKNLNSSYDFVFSKKASDKADGTKMFTLIQKYKHLNITYTEFEIHIRAEYNEIGKKNIFVEICHYFSEIL